MNNYRAPGSTVSPTYNLYKYSPAPPNIWISIDSPATNGVVTGDALITSSVGGGSISSVKFSTRASGATAWVPNGSYQIRAEAYSADRLMATGIIAVTVAN